MSRRRENNPDIPLRDCNGFHVRYIPIRQGAEMVDEGLVSSVYAPRVHGKPRTLLAFQFRAPRDFKPTPASLTISDCELNCFISHTLGMTETRKLQRVEKLKIEQGKHVLPEDRAELAKAKVAFWPATHDDRNPATVGPPIDPKALEMFL